MRPWRWIGVIAALVTLALTWPAYASGGACQDVNHPWIVRCSRESGLQLRVLDCPPGHLVMLVRRGAGSWLKVDVTRGSDRAFRRIGSFGLSPVGDFPDWKKVPASMRQAFDGLSDCARHDPSLQLSGLFSRTSAKSWPWFLVVALLVAALLVTLDLGRARQRRRRLLTLLALFALGAGCFAARWALLPHTYFHQNGQGPLWVAYALRDAGGLSSYGPGYAELFGAAAHALRQPELGVFVVQAVLGACVAPASWVIARRVGASPLLASAVAGVVALDPLFGRLAQSESYFAACSSLLFLGAAVLAEGAWHARARSLRFNLAVLSAGLFIASAARIHPVCWVAGAVVPGVVLVGRGRLRHRLLLTVYSALGIGLVVLLVAGRAMLEVVRGSLGRQWMPSASPALARHALAGSGLFLAAAVVALGVPGLWLTWRRPRWRSAVVAATLGTLLALLIEATNLIGDPNPSVLGAYSRLFAPVGVAVIAALLASLCRSRRGRLLAGVGVGVFALAHAVWARSLAFEQPTDVQEEAWASQWRSQLPAGSVVIYLQRAGKRVEVLPFYGRVSGFNLTARDPPPELGTKGVHLYYYRSSLCSTSDGRGPCRALERHYSLKLVDSRTLPARPSMRWLRYDSPVIRVELYRVTGVSGTAE